MADEADLAQAHLEAEDTIRRKYTRRPVMEAEATGECLNCYEPVSLDMRWCDRDCQDDWQKRRNK
jgi:hypothetical protein